MPKEFLSSIFTYPWDLTDEGLDASLARIADAALCREVMLTPSYHIGTYFLPHNPVRGPFYSGENGAVYFTPQSDRYAKTRIKPRVSEVVAGPRYMDEIVAAIGKRGLSFGAWIVYLFNHHLARTYPQFAVHDAFGHASPARLSPASGDVQEYVVALTADVVENYRPRAVYVESLQRLFWSYGFLNPKIVSEITPRCTFLLGLCFNPSSLALANEAGLDAERLRQEIVDYLRPRLTRLPNADDMAPAAADWIAEAFDGQLARYMEAGRKATTSLWLRVADVIHKGGAELHGEGPVDDQSALKTDLDESINSRLDRVSVSPPADRASGTEQIEQIRGRIAKDGKVLAFLSPGTYTEAGPLAQHVHQAAAAGANGATFYNYGLLREEQLAFIGAALRTM